MKNLLYFESFNENLDHNLSLNDELYQPEELFRIETSLGFIDIPKKIIDQNIDHDYYKREKWHMILSKLYTFSSIYYSSNNSQWVSIELDDSYYGNPEYKIIEI